MNVRVAEVDEPLRKLPSKFLAIEWVADAPDARVSTLSVYTPPWRRYTSISEPQLLVMVSVNACALEASSAARTAVEWTEARTIAAKLVCG